MSQTPATLERKLAIVVLLMLVGGCVLVLLPFLTAAVWAGVLSFAIWPFYCRVLRWVGGRRAFAALLVTGGMAFTVLFPLLLVGMTLADNVHDLTASIQEWIAAGPPPPPAWLAKLPLVGKSATETWKALAADSARLLKGSAQFIEPVGAWLLRGGMKLGHGLVELALSLLISFFLLRNGLRVVKHLNRGIEQIAGENGKRLLLLAGNTVRGVVYGILGTSLIQAVAAAVGLLVAGVPGAGLLSMLVFVLSVVPAGTLLVFAPASLWLFHQGSTGWAIFLFIWGLGVGTIDNFVRPWLISQGSDLPFMLILFGVLGGALAFGFIGIFIGPTLLAVGHRLVREWLASNRRSPSAPVADSP